jgi:hypothetical protein
MAGENLTVGSMVWLLNRSWRERNLSDIGDCKTPCCTSSDGDLCLGHRRAVLDDRKSEPNGLRTDNDPERLTRLMNMVRPSVLQPPGNV